MIVLYALLQDLRAIPLLSVFLARFRMMSLDTVNLEGNRLEVEVGKQLGKIFSLHQPRGAC